MAERFNPEKDKDWNREPGLVVIQGSNYAREMEKFEQFPSKYGSNPGNPYVYRPFPKMVYRAEVYRGRVACGAVAPDPGELANPNEFQRLEESAKKFTERCQMIVKDERELQAARENGWRSSPQEAVEYMEAHLRSESDAAAIREYEDRGMSEAAKAEAKEAAAKHFDEAGRQLGAVPEKPRRGRPRKSAV